MRRSVRRRQFLRTGAVGVFVGLAGCGASDEDQRGTPTDTETTTPMDSSPAPTEQTPEETTEDTDPVDILEHDRLIGAHYYPWYWGDSGFGGRDHATDHPDSWLSATPGEPVLGAYDSRDEDVVNQHMRWSLEHGINWWIITGGGPRGKIDRTIQEVVFEAAYADQMTFTLLVGVPPSLRNDGGKFDFDDPQAPDLLTEQLSYWANNYANNPNYLRLNGHPPIYYWDSGTSTGDMAGAFQAARDALDIDPYIIGGPSYYRQPRRIARNAAAFDAVLEYVSYHPNAEYRESFLPRTVENHQRWRTAAQEYDLDFMPTVTPGFDHTAAPASFRGGRTLPVLERSPERFRDQCRQLRGYGDHETLVITSFNEWPEYTAIEPSEKYGTTYLEIAADELARSEWESPVLPATRVSLRYDRTVRPAKINPDSEDTRPLAIQVSNIEVMTVAGGTEIDVGGDEGRTTFTEGFWGPGSSGERTWRSFGGEPPKTVLFVPVSGPISELSVTGRPVEEGITATIETGDRELGEMTFESGWNSYRVSA